MKRTLLWMLMLMILAVPAFAQESDSCQMAKFSDAQVIEIITGVLIIGIVAAFLFYLPTLITLGAAGYGLYKVLSVLVTVAYYWGRCHL